MSAVLAVLMAAAIPAGLQLGSVAMAAAPPLQGIEGPGGVPHYFGPYGNWAFSPLPKGPVATVTVVDGGTGYSAAPTVTIADAYLPTADITPLMLRPQLLAASLPASRSTAEAPGMLLPLSSSKMVAEQAPAADAVIGGTLTGGIRKFVDKMPGLGSGNANTLTPASAVHPGCGPRD